MLHCDLRVRWKVASDFLAPSTRRSLAIAIVRLWCAKARRFSLFVNLVAFVVARPTYSGHIVLRVEPEETVQIQK